MDTKIRSWVKSITWRILGVIILGAITYWITGSWKEMTAITIIFHTIRIILYYFHERIWEHCKWGKIQHPLCELPVKEKLKPEDLEKIREKLKSLGYID